MTTAELLERASKQKRRLAAATTAEKNEALEKIADALIKHTQNIIDENKKDIDNARGHISDVMIDRLTLDEKRVLINFPFLHLDIQIRNGKTYYRRSFTIYLFYCTNFFFHVHVLPFSMI